MTTQSKPATRMSAHDRRQAILEVAMVEFARKGLHGTSTETIAEHAGVSQPYLFRLFGTKKELFLAAVERNFERVENIFLDAARDVETDKLVAMAQAYLPLLDEPDALLLQLHAYSACSDPDVREVVRHHYAQLIRVVQDTSGASDEEVRDFFAYGMLMTIAAAMNLGWAPSSGEWMKECMVGR